MSDYLFSDQTLPSFSKINPEIIFDSILNIIKDNTKVIDKLKKQKLEKITWESFVVIIEELFVKLANAWSPVSHLNSVMSSDKIRDQYEKSLQEIIKYNLMVEQDADLYKAYKFLLDNKEQNCFTNLQIKLLEDKVRDFKLSGAELSSEDKNKFKQLATELSDLTTKFNNNILDSTDTWAYHLSDEKLLAGIPDNIITLAKANAEENDKQGWLFGLDAPTYLAIMKNSKVRELRASFHYAYHTRASAKGPHDKKYDNTNIMYEILLRRHKMAKMLGFKNYAELSLAPKMVNHTSEVLKFLSDMVESSRKSAQNELEELKLFAKTKDGIDSLKPWDTAYYSELQKKQLFNLSDETLKPYFPLDKALTGFFNILSDIYNITLKENLTADRWHKDVICYDVINCDNDIIGHVYLDLFARKNKRQGAWMDECRMRIVIPNLNQPPVAYLSCNFTQPSNNSIALLTHYDVVTLFHEFGHCLHHLLTTIDYPSLSGINGVPWDAVELPSQLHENWAWQAESLSKISGHYQTSEALPDKYLKQLIKQKNYQSGMFLLRQLSFALFDFKLHLEFHSEKGASQVQDVLDTVRKDIAVLEYADYDQFQHGFSHIFAGGYSAGYYSYLWAEVLAANCFEKFISTGIFCRNTGKSFLDKILSQGGLVDFNQAVTDFCGKEVSVKPLLANYGI